jgi:hypothetical protein
MMESNMYVDYIPLVSGFSEPASSVVIEVIHMGFLALFCYIWIKFIKRNGIICFTFLNNDIKL